MVDFEKAKERLRQRRATIDALRGQPLTPSEQLSNLMTALSPCERCRRPTQLQWRYCAWCGLDLLADQGEGK